MTSSAFWDLAERLGGSRPIVLAKATSGSDVGREAAAAVSAHLDAWLVELLGADVAGVAPERVAWLIEHGYLAANVTIGGVDPWGMAVAIGARLGSAPPGRAEAMRGWTLRDWEQELRETPALPPQGPQAEPARSGTPPGGALIPSPPPGLGDIGREAWIQARTRGAEYVRGLGNIVSDDLETLVREIWDEARVVAEGDREQRLVSREVIREATADAVARGWGSDRLASELGNRMQDWARNWKRIAATELQSAANEGVAIAAIRVDGADTRIARVPEPDACPACRRLFLDPETGKPIIFGVQVLLANGTNVGKKASEWKPTLHPVHPLCRCIAQRVPAGFAFDEDWNLVLEAA